ncbi:MAG: ABC transporter permease [Rhizobacter sp.]|nr:ABC transporter permease [Ferruginibacter sp.]
MKKKSSKYNHSVDSEISFTYLVSQKKLTMVAALGVTIGITVYLFMTSMTSGFDRMSNDSIFKSSPQIRLYKDDEMSRPLVPYSDSNKIAAVVNPKVVPQSNRIVNPANIIAILKQQPGVQIATPQVSVSVFYNVGNSLVNGTSSGVEIIEADKMFSIKATMVEGRMEELDQVPNGILLGVGIAAKMSAETGDNITITSSRNVIKVMKVVGLFETHNSALDKTKSYINIGAAQQLLQEGPSYVSDVNIQIADYKKAAAYAAKFSALTGYKAEDWEAANATLTSGAAVRTILLTSISISILLVAGFGIYNILNMTISSKIQEIAILKAMGFRAGDVVKIFVRQAVMIGLIGLVIGLLFTTWLIWKVSHVYVGGDMGYFPIRFEWNLFLRSIALGMGITLLAGYLPARKAAHVDPVSIFRK